MHVGRTRFARVVHDLAERLNTILTHDDGGVAFDVDVGKTP